jgi:hypothetical protein
MTTLHIPPEHVEDVDRVKEFLYETMASGPWEEAAYLAYADRFPRLVELSEGRLVVLDMPTPGHQRAVQRLFKCLDAWAADQGGEAFVAPLPIRLWPGKFREPDVLLSWSRPICPDSNARRPACSTDRSRQTLALCAEARRGPGVAHACSLSPAPAPGTRRDPADPPFDCIDLGQAAGR